MARRTIAISLAALAGCSFVDDFDKFQLGATGTDAAAPDAKTGDAMRDAGPVSMIDSATQDSSVVDAYVQPVCGGSLCDDEDPCTVDRCDGTKCVSSVLDADGDGYSPGTCKAGSPAAMGGDCDDSRNDVHPGGTEVCDGADNDCNGTTDDGFAKSQCYPDLDRDGYANLDGVPVTSCSACPTLTAPVVDATDRTLHDCFDEGEDADLVHPKQTNYFDRGFRRPNQSGGDRSFDYDCNGLEEPQYKIIDCAALAVAGLGCDGNASGFLRENGKPEAPSCGESGTLQVCAVSSLLTCGVNQPMKQPCH